VIPSLPAKRSNHIFLKILNVAYLYKIYLKIRIISTHHPALIDKNIECSMIQRMDISNIPENYREDIKKAADLLKNEGCKAVFLFGSMATGKNHENSDIDIGIKGLPPENFFKAYSKLYMDLDNAFHLVDFDFDSDFFSLLSRHGEVIEIG